MNDYIPTYLCDRPYPGATSRLVNDWTSARGRTIEVWHAAFPTRIGVVEDVTPDGSILWLASEGPVTRCMIEKAEGYEIWSVQQPA
jgi:hypothetical protein